MIEWVLGPFGWHWEYPRPYPQMNSRLAQAIEARRAETGTGSVEDESAVPKECAQKGGA
jgi:hypothetical protein